MSKEDLISLAKGAGIAAAGAALAFTAQWITGHDFGPWAFVATAVAGVLTNLARKLMFPTE